MAIRKKRKGMRNENIVFITEFDSQEALIFFNEKADCLIGKTEDGCLLIVPYFVDKEEEIESIKKDVAKKYKSIKTHPDVAIKVEAPLVIASAMLSMVDFNAENQSLLKKSLKANELTSPMRIVSETDGETCYILPMPLGVYECGLIHSPFTILKLSPITHK